LEPTYNNTIHDSWHPTGFGYAGPGRDDDSLKTKRMVMSLPGDTNQMELIHLPYYETVQLMYFDLAAQRVVDIAEAWQDCRTSLAKFIVNCLNTRQQL
jgi:hypothetical protein